MPIQVTMEAQHRFERLNDFLKLDPENLRLWHECVEAALEARIYDAALTLADSGMLRWPHDERLLFAKTNALIGRGEYREAKDILSLNPVFRPENHGVKQNLALCLYLLTQYSEAQPYLESLYEAGERSIAIIRLLVSTLHHLGMMDRALDIAEANKDLARADSALAGVYALVYLDANRVADAARCSAISLRLNPNCLDALTVRATLRLASGELDAAKTEFEELLKIRSDLGRAWVSLGSIALLHRDVSRAKECLTKGIEHMPTHVGSWHMLGWTHLLTGELTDAERNFDRAMELNRNFAESHGALASVYALRGELDRARESIEIARRLDSNCLSVRFAKSVIATKESGNSSKAQELIAEGLSVFTKTDAGSLKRFIEIGLAASRSKR